MLKAIYYRILEACSTCDEVCLPPFRFRVSLTEEELSSTRPLFACFHWTVSWFSE